MFLQNSILTFKEEALLPLKLDSVACQMFDKNIKLLITNPIAYMVNNQETAIDDGIIEYGQIEKFLIK